MDKLKPADFIYILNNFYILFYYHEIFSGFR